MPFIDTHTHLHFSDYKADREEVIARARAAGFERLINVGTDVESSRESLRLAETHDFIFATAGIHPHDVTDAGDGPLAAIAEILKHPRVVAIGEVGLDFFRDHSPREKQKEIFRKFLSLYRQTGKPLVVHCRDAYEDLRALLTEGIKPPFRGVMHCFSSDRATMARFLDLGFYISFAGPLTYKKNDSLREACRACPLDRILLETDAPFLPPQSVRGKRNEPGFMLETAALAAGLKGISPEKLGEETTANARALFGLC